MSDKFDKYEVCSSVAGKWESWLAKVTEPAISMISQWWKGNKLVLFRQSGHSWRQILVTNISDKYEWQIWGLRQLLISKSDTCHFYDQPIGGKETSFLPLNMSDKYEWQMWQMWQIWVTNVSDKCDKYEVTSICHFYDQPTGGKETSSYFLLPYSPTSHSQRE